MELSTVNTPNETPCYVVPQDWSCRYSEADHFTWATLLDSSQERSLRKACNLFLEGCECIKFNQHQIPNFEALSEKLLELNGWEVISVNGYLTDKIFFEYILDKKFPTSCDIRSLEESSFQEYPDLFHDIYGHAPLLIYPTITNLLTSCATSVLKALKLDRPDLAKKISALYWFTIEVGLIKESDQIRFYGGAIASSEKETIFATEDHTPNLIKFNLKRIMRTEYNMLDLQVTYFVIDSFDQLENLAHEDLFSIAASLEKLPPLKQGELCDEDEIIQLGRGKLHSSGLSSNISS
jgi:phenylalanine-4-hydroxylase